MAKKTTKKTTTKAATKAATPTAAETTPKVKAKTTPRPTTRQLAVSFAQIALANKSTDVVVLDLRGLSNTTDYFVIATGTSNRQMRTVADEISKAAKAVGSKRFGLAGYEQARWVVLDFVDVVVHVFDREYRDYYNLEMLWGDAKKVRVAALKQDAPAEQVSQ